MIMSNERLIGRSEATRIRRQRGFPETMTRIWRVSESKDVNRCLTGGMTDSTRVVDIRIRTELRSGAQRRS